MPDDQERSDVRIVVPRPSSDSEDDSFVRTGPPIQTPDPIVVVPVTDTLLESQTGINVRRFLQTAVALAADTDGRVLLLGIETVSGEAALDTLREYVRSDHSADPDTPAVVETVERRRTQLAEMASVAQELTQSVQVTAAVRAVTDVTEGILDVLGDGVETSALLPRSSGLDEGWLLNRSTIDTILAEAACDVFVENMGVREGENALYVPNVGEHTVAPLADSAGATVDSILLPVGMGPHAALAAEAARAVARSADASVTVLHVVSPDDSAAATADGEDLLRFAEYVLGDDVETETVLREASDTTESIVNEAEEYDFVSIGAPEQKSGLEQIVFGSVQETIAELSEATILMARDADETNRSLYYRWKRGIEAIDDENETDN